jgi:hypothetical protein
MIADCTARRFLLLCLVTLIRFGELDLEPSVDSHCYSNEYTSTSRLIKTEVSQCSQN